MAKFVPGRTARRWQANKKREQAGGMPAWMKRAKAALRSRPAPQKRQQAKRVWKPKYKGRAPSGHTGMMASKFLAPTTSDATQYFNAKLAHERKLHCISTLRTMGQYTPIYCERKWPFATIADSGFILMVQFSFAGVALWKIREAGVIGPGVGRGFTEAVPFPEIVAAPPTDLRNSRKTITLLNATASQTVSHLFNVATFSAPLILEALPAQAGTHINETSIARIEEICNSSAHSKQYSSHALVGGLSFSLGMASVTEGAAWRPWNAAQDMATLVNEAKMGAGSTILIQFPSAAVNQQSIGVTISTQLACRYPPTSLHSNNTVAGGAGFNPQQAAMNQHITSSTLASGR